MILLNQDLGYNHINKKYFMSVILTGYTSSIGKALLNNFLAQGKNVTCLGRSDIPNEICNNFKDLKKKFFLDFKSNSFENDLEEIYSDLNAEEINTIIHAAADTGKRNLLKNLNYQEISDLITINYLNSAWFLKKSCDLLSLNKNSFNKSFIYISTQLAKYKGPGLSIYSSSKAGINNLCKTLAHEYGSNGVRVNIVTPGIISDDPANTRKYDERLNIPLSRLATPNDVVNAVSFLISKDSSYITGNDLNVNGGR